MNYTCQYCKKEFTSVYQKGSHQRFCKLNPNYQKNIQKHKSTSCKAWTEAGIISCKEKAENNPLNQIQQYNFTCPRCGKDYSLKLKVREFQKGYYMKFCSRSCANKRVHSEETKQKIKNGVLNKLNSNSKHICPTCGKEFFYQKNIAAQNIQCDQCYFKTHKRNAEGDNNRSRKNQTGEMRKCECHSCGITIYTKHVGITYCYQCADKLNLYKFKLYDESGKVLVSENTKEKLSKSTKKLLKEGKIKPWQSRNIISYSEKFFRKVLQLNKIQYQPEYPESGYFLDFVVKTKSGVIDLEIDGKQHWEDKERIESDKIRDKKLKQIGYIVYRIPWNSLNSQNGKFLMKKKILDFLIFYKNLNS